MSSCLPLPRNPWPVRGERAQTWPRQGPFPSGPLGSDRKSSPSQADLPVLHHRGHLGGKEFSPLLEQPWPRGSQAPPEGRAPLVYAWGCRVRQSCAGPSCPLPCYLSGRGSITASGCSPFPWGCDTAAACRERPFWGAMGYSQALHYSACEGRCRKYDFSGCGVPQPLITESPPCVPPQVILLPPGGAP